ncbi:MAG TPA: hypothetical protein VF920_12655 [Dongiaceae bacterium]
MSKQPNTQLRTAMRSLIAVSLLCLATAGCANILRHPAPPETAAQATMVGYTHIRYLPFSDPEPTCGRAVGTLLKVSGINDISALSPKYSR